LADGRDGGSIASDALTWLQDRWRILLAVALLVFVYWKFSGKRPEENGRFVLVKDDVPCQSVREDEGRRWCYVVLDTRTGRLEERGRRMGQQKHK